MRLWRSGATAVAANPASGSDIASTSIYSLETSGSAPKKRSKPHAGTSVLGRLQFVFQSYLKHAVPYVITYRRWTVLGTLVTHPNDADLAVANPKCGIGMEKTVDLISLSLTLGSNKGTLPCRAPHYDFGAVVGKRFPNFP